MAKRATMKIPDINVKELRVKLGLTQNELAQKLNTSVTTIARWESGKVKPQGYYRRWMQRMNDGGKAPSDYK